jgi:gliding motility-associated-like protein
VTQLKWIFSFPSAFTPNGDGLNDLIGVVGTLKYYTNFSLSIYNRWGQRVFYTEDIYAGWDGIFNGTKQDLGTYFYMIYYSLEGKKHMMKGDFQLIR